MDCTQEEMKPSLTVDPGADKDNTIEFWGNVPFAVLHLGCLLVFAVGWSPLALGIAVFFFLIRTFALTAGYHRYFSHRSFKTSRVFQFILAFVGMCAFQKDPLWWAAHHRDHHRFADQENDVHSPVTKSFFWAHMGWVMTKKNANLEPYDKVPDLARFPELRYLHRNQKLPAFAMLGILTLIGVLIEKFYPESGTTTGQVIVWSFFVSTIFLHHTTFCVNSLCHMYGSKRFQINNEARNNWFVALLTMGEGWHNNHHRFPSSERQGFYWWEIDMTHWILKGLSLLGIVWDLRRPPQEIYDEAEKSRAAAV